MGLDIRLPLGLIFLIIGGLMSVYGFFTRHSAVYAKSMDINLNLTWGAIMFVFGLVMFLAQIVKELGLSPSDWAKLPPHMQQDLLNAAQQRGPAAYQQMIKDYYTRIARMQSDGGTP